MYWLEVSVVTDGEGAEAVAEALRPFAYDEGVVLEQSGDVHDPNPDALEEVVTVKIYIPGDEDNPALRRRLEEIVYHLGRLYALPLPAFRQLEEADWASAWKVNYRPFRIGDHIWIRPSWLADDREGTAEPGDIVLTLDPGMAFGTGLHPTTQMCLQALEQVIQPGMRLLDVGTGSGILAIAAAKSGAGAALAVDTDELAVKTAASNAAQNGVRGQMTIRQGSLATVVERGWDIVVVNILAPVIITLLGEGKLLDYVTGDGYLILSGILDQQAAEVESAVTRAGGRVAQPLVVRDWISFIVRHA